MKKLAFVLLFLTGCSSVPYSIEMVNVGDVIEYQRPAQNLKGCTLEVANIETKRLDCPTNTVVNRVPYDSGSLVCGMFTCNNKTEWSCFTFEAFRLDRPTHSEQRPIGDRR